MGVPQTIRTGQLGKRQLRLVRKEARFYGLSDGKICTEGDDADRVWACLHGEAGKFDPNYFGFAGARSRFLKFFPIGFLSEEYATRERDYKVAAKTKLDENVPLQHALSGTGFGEAVLKVFRATNLLSPFEQTRLQNVLRGPGADDVIQAAAAFATEGSKAALLRLDAALKSHDCAKWTIATYLPYLWRPTEHMFLKPRVTKEFAARVGHPFADVYDAGLNFELYETLLDLVAKTETAISDLAPRDHIDLQSFIWIVGEYREEQDPQAIPSPDVPDPATESIVMAKPSAM